MGDSVKGGSLWTVQESARRYLELRENVRILEDGRDPADMSSKLPRSKTREDDAKVIADNEGRVLLEALARWIQDQKEN